MKITVLAIALSFAIACVGAAKMDSSANAVSAAPQPTDGTYVPTPRPDDGAPRITLADAKKDFDEGTAIFIDTRSSDQYKEGHIPGAINLSLSDILAGKDDKLPKGKKIIAYCS